MAWELMVWVGCRDFWDDMIDWWDCLFLDGFSCLGLGKVWGVGRGLKGSRLRDCLKLMNCKYMMDLAVGKVCWPRSVLGTSLRFGNWN